MQLTTTDTDTLDIRKSSHASFPALLLLKPNNYYNHGFPTTFNYNHYVYSDCLISVLSACYCSHYTLLSICDSIATMKIKGLYNI